MIDTIVQWATILSPIIAVLLAWWTSRCSAKESAKKIDALEKSTTRQVESIKELSHQMIEATIKQVELQILQNLTNAKQAKQELEGIRNINNAGLAHLLDWKEISIKKFKEDKPERDYKLFCDVIKQLKELKRGLENKIEEYGRVERI